MNLLTILMLSLFSFSSSQGFKLPASWTPDLKITVESGGGKRNERIRITLTYDSCSYYHQLNGREETTSVTMTETKRAEILNKLRMFRMDKLRSERTRGIVYDMRTDAISLTLDKHSFSVSEGSTTQVHEADRADFRNAFNYLVALVNPNVKTEE